MSVITPTGPQTKAIEHEGHLVVVAKPGSGKTYILSEKIRRILPALEPHQGVIAISYTNKASDELRKRSTLNGIDTKASFFGTIDSFCQSEIVIPFLRQIWGVPTEDITVSRIRDLPSDEQEQFSQIKENTVSEEDLQIHLGLIRKYYLSGTLFLETGGALALFALTNSLAARRFIAARYSHIFVDEYQDSGLEQHGLFLYLKDLGLIAVSVGDTDQSIFAFSNKDPRYLLELVSDDDFKMIPIEKNHRSHPSIINYSLRLMKPNCDLLESDELRVFCKQCNGDVSGISAWLDLEIPKCLEQYEVMEPCRVAVLVRYGATGSKVNKCLRTKHRFFSAHPLEEHFSLWSKLFCALLAFRVNSTRTAEDIIDRQTVMLSQKETIEARKMIKALRRIPATDVVEAMIKIARFILPRAESSGAVDILRSQPVEAMAEHFKDAGNDEIQIMTLHKSKGLEFDIVFHLDLHEWVLPTKRPGPGNDFNNPEYPSLSQDLNLHYVGITRAKKACFLVTGTKRLNSNLELKNAKPSEFLSRDGLVEMRTRL